MKKLTRKQFIQIGTLAGASLALSACGVENKDSQREPGPAGDSAANSQTPSATDAPLDLVRKGDERYDALRQGFNTRIDRYPREIAVCTTTEAVARAMQHASALGLPIAVKSGGHSMEGYSCNNDGFVVNLSRMNSVRVVDDGKLIIGPGCTLRELYDSILPKGLLLPAGSCASVGIGGLTLGGGYGIFSRAYGLTCDHLVEATMVDGSGNIRHTTDDPELLWALKGGGTGNFGVVTEMIFTARQAPPTLQAHYLKARKLTAARAANILERWMDLAPSMPSSCFSAFVLNGSTLNILITSFKPEDHEKLEPTLKELSALVDTTSRSGWGQLNKMLPRFYGSRKPLSFRNSSAGFFTGYRDVAPFITEVFAQVISTPGMMYQVNTIGGKINDAAHAASSSYPHRRYDFISELQGYPTHPSQEGAIARATTSILENTREHGITAQYVNYCSSEFTGWETAYWGENYARLQAVKKRYDPEDNISHPQSVKVAAS